MSGIGKLRAILLPRALETLAALASILALAAGCVQPWDEREGGADPAERAIGGEPRLIEDTDAFGKIFLARALELAGDLEGAVAAYALALEEDPESSLAAVSLARVLYRSGNPVAAAGALSKLEHKGDPYAGIMTVDMLDAAGRGADADSKASAMVARGMLPPECADWLSARNLKLGHVLRASEALAAAAPPEGRPGLPLERAGFLLLDLGFHSKAREAFAAALSADRRGRSRLGLAMALDALRERREAALEAGVYCRENRADLRGVVTAADIMARAGMKQEALDCLEKACELPGADSASEAARGRLLRVLGRSAEAAAALRKASALAPHDRKIAFERATALHEAGDAAASERLLLDLTASVAKPEPHAAAYLAYLFALRGVRLAQAENLARLAAAAEPEQGFYHAVLGLVLHRLGDAAKARSAFAEAARLDADPLALSLHGDFLHDSGDAAGAAKLWREAAGLDPRMRQAMEDKAKAAGQ